MKLRQSGAAIRLRYICDSEGGVVTYYSEKIMVLNTILLRLCHRLVQSMEFMRMEAKLSNYTRKQKIC